MTSEFYGGNDPYPVGAIIPWFGPVDDIPHGWSFCNGENGTPDLSNRFPRSVPDSTTDPGATGGKNRYRLTEAQLPAHNHPGDTENSGTHHHYVSESASGKIKYSSSNEDGPNSVDDFAAQSTADGSHEHQTKNSSKTGGDARVDNRPGFVQMPFIQKQPLE